MRQAASAPEISPCALFWAEMDAVCVCVGCHSSVLQPRDNICSKGTRASAHVNIVGFKPDNAYPGHLTAWQGRFIRRPCRVVRCLNLYLPS